MTKWTRIITTSTALTFAALLFGFVVFGIVTTRNSETSDIQGDGIVVLTGGEARITAAATLLRQQRAKRLLISGVNKSIKRKSLLKLSGLSAQTFDCCVDVGYRALNTAGNADETRVWVKKHNFKRVIVVTSGYHMPRSLMELRRALPDTKFIPHAVMPTSLRKERWWLHRNTMRVLVSEYLKFLPSAARYAGSRFVTGWGRYGTGAGAGNAHAEL